MLYYVNVKKDVTYIHVQFDWMKLSFDIVVSLQKLRFKPY